MISLSIKDVKLFMSHLLIKDTFDSFFLSEADISTANNFTINGNINRDFFSNEEFEALENKKYSLWKMLRPFCFSLIKGNRVPSSMKIIFLLSDSQCNGILSAIDTSLTADDINGLFMNIRYQNGQLSIITGSSIKIFTLDKSIDKAFDQYVCHFLSAAGIAFEEI
ncbi:MAG: DUF5721 family protein [Eubacteriales bacterium]|nr:DUF5721 family protein [Eubacteriales bacterium]